MAVLDLIGSGPGRDPDQDSLKRLWNKGGESGKVDGMGQEGNITYPRTPSPRTPSPQSPPSFSPPPSAPSTLLKPKPRQRDADGRHSLPSAQSLHLVLNSLNREQDEESGRGKGVIHWFLFQSLRLYFCRFLAEIVTETKFPIERPALLSDCINCHFREKISFILFLFS